MIIRGGGAGTNPFQIFENGSSNGGGVVLNGNNTTAGKTQRGADTLTIGEKTIVMLIIGTSIESNSCPAYTVINTTKNDNLNIYDGHLWQYADPYLGPSTGPGSYPGSIADALLTDGTKFNRSVAIGCAMGGATSKDFAREGTFAHRLIAALLYCKKNGYPLSGSGDGGNWKMTCIHSFGPNDIAQSYTTTEYTNYSNSCFNLLRDYGYTGRIYVPTNTCLAGATNSGFATAQSALIDNSKGIYGGINMDSYITGTYRSDGTHLTTTGVSSIRNDWKVKWLADY